MGEQVYKTEGRRKDAPTSTPARFDLSPAGDDCNREVFFEVVVGVDAGASLRSMRGQTRILRERRENTYRVLRPVRLAVLLTLPVVGSGEGLLEGGCKNDDRLGMSLMSEENMVNANPSDLASAGRRGPIFKAGASRNSCRSGSSRLSYICDGGWFHKCTRHSYFNIVYLVNIIQWVFSDVFHLVISRPGLA